MKYELIVELEKVIEDLDNPRKQIIARELIVNPNFEILDYDAGGKKTILIKEKKSGNAYKFVNYVNTLCGC